MRALPIALVTCGLAVACSPPRPAQDPQEVALQRRLDAQDEAERAELARKHALGVAEVQRMNDAAGQLRERIAAEEARRAMPTIDLVAASREAALEADCATDREARRDHQHAFQLAIMTMETKERSAQSWIDAHCRRVEAPTLERRPCDDGGSVMKICTVRNGSHEELRCPPGAPVGVTQFGVEIPETPSDARASKAYEQDGGRNRNCGDVAELRYRER